MKCQIKGSDISPTLLNLYLDDTLRWWKQRLEILNFSDSFSKRNFVKTLMFADEQGIIADNKISLQRVLYELQQIISVEIIVIKTKYLAFKGCFPVRCKRVLNDQLTGHVQDVYKRQ